jgi:hypothetical protein
MTIHRPRGLHAPTYLDNEFRQLFRNLAFPDRTRNLDVEAWVKYAKKVGATSVFLDIKASHAYWETTLIPRDPYVGDRDLAAELACAAKKYGLKYCFYIQASNVDSILEGHDHWQCRTADGGLEARNWGWCATQFCYNSDYRDLLQAMMREATEKYRPHGWFVDCFNAGFSACYCETCVRKYRADTGRSIPVKPDWSDPDWYAYLAWRNLDHAEAARLMHEAVHSVDERVAIVWNSAAVWRGWYGAQSPAKCQWLDFACAEHVVGSLGGELQRFPAYTYADLMAWTMAVTRAYQFGQRVNYYQYFQPHVQLAEAVLATNMIAAGGAQLSLQEHSNHTPKVMQRLRQVEPYLRDARSAADVALHFSESAHNAYYHPDGFGTDLSFYHETGGVFKGLLAAQSLAEAVCDEGLEESDLSGYRLIVLPNSVHLSPAATENLRRYVENGGSVLASLETGRRDACGRPQGDELLWAGSGLKTGGAIETLVPRRDPPRGVLSLEADRPAAPEQFLVFKSRPESKTWIGEDPMLGRRPDGVERAEGPQITDRPSCHLPAQAVDLEAGPEWKTLFRLRFRRTREAGWQECPAAVTRRYGKGRITYVNFQMGTVISSTGHAWWLHLLKQLLAVTAGTGTVRIQAAPCVKSFLWRQPAKRRCVLHLVNELSSGGVREMQHADHIPVPATVKIALPGVRTVKAVIGGKGCTVKRIGKTWTVRHAGIVERLVLVCQQD